MTLLISQLFFLRLEFIKEIYKQSCISDLKNFGRNYDVIYAEVLISSNGCSSFNTFNRPDVIWCV